MKKLLGMTWDHPRGFDSIVAATEAYHMHASDCHITWHKRSLKDFGDFPIERLIEKYDMIMIDHPFVGEAQEKKLLHPLESILPAEFMSSQNQAHIGPTFESYSYGGEQWALPVDAATQVGAYNPKLISLGSLPINWTEYTEMMAKTSFATKVLWPLCETDTWCSFLTIAAQLGSDPGKSVFSAGGLTSDLAVEALTILRELTKSVMDDCWKMNPINTLELMSRKGSEFAFSPLLFGYNNYSRPEGDAQRIEFCNALSVKQEKPVALLGGVGLAVSSKSQHHKILSDYLRFIMQEQIISGAYFDSGGQPSTSSVWMSKDINRRTAGFFSNTIASMERAFVRPRVAGFNIFQEKAARFLHSKLAKKGSSEASIVDSLNGIYKESCLS